MLRIVNEKSKSFNKNKKPPGLHVVGAAIAQIPNKTPNNGVEIVL